MLNITPSHSPDMTRPSALATRNIDLLWDTRKRILFSTQLARVDSSMRGVLKKVGSSSLLRWTSFAASKPVTTHTLSNSATRPKAFGSPRPAAFVAFKRWMAEQADRDPLKRSRDKLQADAVQELLVQYFPQF